MKIAVNQSTISYEDKYTNYKNARRAIQDAKEEKADLVAFPEVSFTGFTNNVELIGEKNRETIEYMSKLACEYEIAIAFGWVKYNELHKEEKAENHYSIVSKQGTVLLDYVKSHPFSYTKEDEKFTKGNQLAFCFMEGFRISVAICYDLRFPELFQAESKYADIILVPANWPESRREHWRTLLRARAIENQCYIIGINCTGRTNEIDYSGDSLVIHPDGTILLDLQKESGLKMIDLQNEVELVRKGFPMKQDRREDYYIKLYQSQS